MFSGRKHHLRWPFFCGLRGLMIFSTVNGRTHLFDWIDFRQKAQEIIRERKANFSESDLASFPLTISMEGGDKDRLANFLYKELCSGRFSPRRSHVIEKPRTAIIFDFVAAAQANDRSLLVDIRVPLDRERDEAVLYLQRFTSPLQKRIGLISSICEVAAIDVSDVSQIEGTAQDFEIQLKTTAIRIGSSKFIARSLSPATFRVIGFDPYGGFAVRALELGRVDGTGRLVPCGSVAEGIGVEAARDLRLALDQGLQVAADVKHKGIAPGGELRDPVFMRWHELSS